MTRQPYTLNHPLYPHPDLLKYYNDHKVQYRPHQGTYDDAYNNWYQLVRADHDLSGAPIRPITREIQQIIRLRSSGQEFIRYSETLYGQDHEHNTIPFFHTYGDYNKPIFRTMFNYETRKSTTIPTGQIETVYFIPYSQTLIDELYDAGPDNMDIELLVTVGSRQYGGRGFFTHEEFRDLPLDELARIGREGKGMFTQLTSNIPVGTMSQELKVSGAQEQQSKLWQEFLEFQKFKAAQQGQTITTTTIQTQQQIPEPTQPPSRIKVKGVNEK